MRKTKRKCKQCSADISHARKGNIYCSDICGERYRNNKRNALKEHTCAICNGKFTGRKKKYCSQNCADEARRIRNRERWRAANPDWNKEVTKECEWCNAKYTVHKRYEHQSRFCSEECQQTYHSRQKGHRPLDEWVSIREERKRKRQAKLDKKKAIRSLRDTLTKMIKLKKEEEKIEELTRKCAECGAMFYNPHPLVMTCSNRCSRKRSNRIRRIKEEGRINKHNLVDKGITLAKLYKRDNGICYLCGEPCDFEDKVITKEGHYIVGPTYPSMDHVKPLSKGGKHSWTNVKLSHHSCNTNKRDSDVTIYLKTSG